MSLQFITERKKEAEDEGEEESESILLLHNSVDGLEIGMRVPM